MRAVRAWGDPGDDEQFSSVHVPPGWPVQVRPPGAPDWERTATAFLFDACPPDCRAYPVLRRFPVVLARFAAVCVAAQLRACADGLAECRAVLRDVAPPDAVEAAASVWQEQTAALRRAAREITLVEEALRGRQFVEKL